MADPTAAGLVHLLDPSGQVVALSPAEAEAAAPLGYLPASPEQIADYQRTAAFAEKYGTPGQTALAGVEGAASALTFGLSTAAERALGVPAEDIAGREQANPIASGVGTALGIAAPLVLTAGASAPASAAAAAAKGAARFTGPALAAGAGRAVTGAVRSALPEAGGLAGQIAARAAALGAGSAVEGAAYGLGQVVHEAALGDPHLTAQSALAEIGLTAALGGGLGFAGGAMAGLAKGALPSSDIGAKLASWLGEAEGTRNIKAAGAIQSDISRVRKQVGGERLNKIGREMGELGLVGPFSTPARTLEKANALMREAGDEIGSILRGADDAVQIAPRMDDVVGRATADVLGPLRANPLQQDAANRLEAVLAGYKEKFAAGATLSDLHGMRRQISDALYGLRGNQDPFANAFKDALHDLRSIVSEEIGTGIEKAGASSAAWKVANRRYEVASRAAEFAQKGLDRAQGNNLISLTEGLGALGGGLGAGPLGALATGAATAAVRRHGSGVLGWAARGLREALEGAVPAEVDAARRIITEEAAAPTARATAGTRTTRVVTPQRRLGEPARYEVVEADDLMASHNPQSFTQRKDYPAGVQEREYHRVAEEQAKVVLGAQRLNPALILADTPTAVDGPPIVTKGRPVVLGGNGRAMMLQRAFKDAGARDAYRQALIEKAPALGIAPKEIEKLRAPVLVRVLDDLAADAPAADLAAAVRRFNEGMTQGLSPQARAVSEARLLSQPTMDAIGELLSGSGDASLRDVMRARPREFVEALSRDGVVTAENRAQWLAGSELTDEAKDRIEGMFLGRVVGTGDRLAATPPATLRKIERAAPHLVRVSGVNPAAEEISTVQAAIDLMNDARRRGMSLDDIVNQGSLFGGPAVDPAAAAMARFLDGAGQRQVSERFQAWAQVAAVDPRQGSLFGAGPTPEAVRRELLGPGAPGRATAPASPPAAAAETASAAVPTWREFVQQRMAAYMKKYGGHGPAMKAIGEEWQAIKAGKAAETVTSKTAEAIATERRAVAMAGATETIAPRATNAAETVAALAALERAKKATENRISAGVTMLVNASSRAALIGRAEVSAGVARSFGAPLESATRTFQRRTSEIQALAQDPDQMHRALLVQNEGLEDHAPDTAQALSVASSRAVVFLASKAPRAPERGPLAPKWQPSQAEIAKFNRYYEAVQRPTSILKQAAAGTLTPEAVEAVATVYPELYARIQAALVDKIAGHSGAIPYPSRLMAGLLLGQDLDGTAGLLGKHRASFAGPSGKPSAAVPGPIKPTSSGASKITLSTRSLTPQQKAAQR